MKPKNKDTKQKNEENEIGIIEIPIELKKNEWRIIGEKKKWIRNCPKCNKEILYGSVYGRNGSNKKNRLCKTCCKLGNKNGRFGKGYILGGEKHFNFGKHLPKRVRDKIGKGNRGKHIGIKNSMYGKMGDLSPNKGKLTGKKNPMYGRCGKLNPNYGNRYKLSDDVKRRIRVSLVNRLKRLYGNSNKKIPNFNPESCEYFYKLEKENGWGGCYATKNGEYLIKELGYWVDYYEPNQNIVIEYDEKHHYVYGNLKEKDIKRMDEIKNHLKCRFFRYNEYTKELKEF